MTTSSARLRVPVMRALFGLALALCGLPYEASAALLVYDFSGTVNGGSGPGQSVPAALQSQFSIGQPVTLSFVVDTATAESGITTGSPKFAYYPDAVTSWSATFGSYTASGAAGYVSVCDSGTTTGPSPDCYTPYFPGINPDGMDGVRFVGGSLTPMGPQVNGYDLCGPFNTDYGLRQCIAANIIDPTGSAFTGDAIPPWLDPVAFTSGNTRLIFTDVAGTTVFVTSDLRPIPEPATLALVGLGLAGLGFSRRKQ